MAIQINGNGTITGISVGGLPDGIVDTDMIANSAVTSAKSSGLGGVTEADQWRITSNQTINAHQGYNWGNANVMLTSNWERNDTYFDKIGTGLTESSGVFTFPSNGIYNIRLQYGGRSNSADSQWIGTVSYTHLTLPTTPYV